MNRRYDSVARLLHWAMAALILMALGLGLRRDGIMERML
jgi:cytochrome b561